MKVVTKQEDNAKVAMLGVGVVVIFGFVVFRVMSALGGPGAPAPSGDSTIGASGPQVPLPGGGAIEAAPSAVDNADIVIPTFAAGTTPNPFHRDVDDQTLKNIQIAADPYRAALTKKHNNGSTNGGNGTFTAPTTEVKPDLEPMEVKGIMGSVAVIQVGDRQYVVEKGSLFGNRLRLVNVSPTQITIQEGKTIHNLKVGQRTATPVPQSAKPILPKLSGTIPANQKESGLLLPQ